MGVGVAVGSGIGVAVAVGTGVGVGVAEGKGLGVAVGAGNGSGSLRGGLRDPGLGCRTTGGSSVSSSIVSGSGPGGSGSGSGPSVGRLSLIDTSTDWTIPWESTSSRIIRYQYRLPRVVFWSV